MSWEASLEATLGGGTVMRRPFDEDEEENFDTEGFGFDEEDDELDDDEDEDFEDDEEDAEDEEFGGGDFVFDEDGNDDA